MARRNPAATRARILAAAEELFAASGFAGTRIDAVAARSGANKRMIYHYFGGKEALFEAVLRHRLAEVPWGGAQGIDATAARLIAWEGLERTEPVAAPGRADAIAGFIGELKARLGEGQLRMPVDPGLLALALVGARLVPLIAPGLAGMIVGERRDFKARYRSLLNILVDALAPAAPAAKPRVTLRPRVAANDAHGGFPSAPGPASPQRFASEENTSK